MTENTEGPGEVEVVSTGDEGAPPAHAGSYTNSDGPAPRRRQPAQEDLRRQAPQPREGGTGKFQHKNPMDDVRDVARKALRGETLDSAPKGGKDPGAKQDPATDKARGATGKDTDEKTSREATRHAEKLGKARKALELEGWTEDDLDGIPDEKLMSLGDKATQRHAEKAAELRKKAAEAKAAEQDPDEDVGATAREQPSGKKASKPDAYTALAKEHFAQFEEDSGFQDSLAQYTRAAFQHQGKDFEARLTKMQADFETKLEEAANAIRGGLRVESAMEKLGDDFPQARTKEGRAELERKALALGSGAEVGEYGSADDLVRAAANACWGEARRKELSDKAKADKLRAARGAGQPNPHGTSDVPRKKSDLDITRDAVREAMMR